MFLSESKILVFIEGNTKYGLMVDSIDSIVSFTSDQAMNMPAFANSKTAKKSAVGIKNAIQIKKSDKSKSTLLEIDIHYIIEKIGASEQSTLAIPYLDNSSTESLTD